MNKAEQFGLVVLSSQDDERYLGPVSELMDGAGLVCLRCDSPDNALQKIADHSPLVALVFTSSTRPVPRLESIVASMGALPVVALNAAAAPVDPMRLLEAGCADILPLPFSVPGAAERSINRQLQRAKRIAESDNLRLELEQSLALLKEDQQAGRHVQRKMLPPQELIINDYRFEYRISPSLFLSGDFIDFFRISESLSMFYLADISGHGASSAFVTVLLKNMTNRLLRNYNRGSSFHILSPTDVLSRINKELLDTGLGKHLTIFVGLLDRIENTLQYGVGGHYPMPILQQNGQAAFLEGTGMPVGLFDDAEFDGRIVELEDEFCLTLFSDGILEVMDLPDLKAKERKLLDVAAAGYRDLNELAVQLGVDQVRDAPDDIAALSVSRVV